MMRANLMESMKATTTQFLEGLSREIGTYFTVKSAQKWTICHREVYKKN